MKKEWTNYEKKALQKSKICQGQRKKKEEIIEKERKKSKKKRKWKKLEKESENREM